MKTKAIQQADTRKTTSLLKKHLKETFGVTFRIKTQKFSMGDSMDIYYVAGPDESKVDAIVNKLQRGYFNGMEDVYESVDNEGLVIDGYQLEEWKYVSVHQEIPDSLFFQMAKMYSDEFNLEGIDKLETIEQLDAQFSEPFGSAWNWRQLVRSRIRVRNFVTDDVENIKIVGIEDDPKDSFNHIFTYEYNGKMYNTMSLEPLKELTYQIVLLDKATNEIEKVENFKTYILSELKNRLYELQLGYCEDEKPEVFEKMFTSNGKNIKALVAECDVDFCYMAAIKEIEENTNNTNNNLNTTEKMETKDLQELGLEPMMKVKVTYKDGKEITGTVLKAGTKSITVQAGQEKKLVMFAAEPTIEKLDDMKNGKDKTTKEHQATTEKKAETKKPATKKSTGTKKTTSKKEDVKYEEPLNDEEKKLAAKQAKAAEKKAKKPATKKEEKPKTEKTENKAPELHPILEAIKGITDEKTFNSVAAEVAKSKIKFQSIKKGFEVEITEFKNGNIYVKDVENEKNYFSLPARFPVHFTVVE